MAGGTGLLVGHPIQNFESLVRTAGADWHALGDWGSIGVLIMSTESYVNRLIPPGVSPAFATAFGLPNVLNASDATSAASLTS